MTADALAVIDTYTTALTRAQYAWRGLLAATGAAAVLAGYHAANRIGASFTRAHHTIADIQQREEKRP
ncbi:hypothetical protein [Streptomyces sp.]|uniref:hypothetical protein n=1 Tax=Streptomyces sp. TaxID=1931 RepID=UPI002811F1C9|nr:hypothetical protein [Streptomyces sp.]